MDGPGYDKTSTAIDQQPATGSSNAAERPDLLGPGALPAMAQSAEINAAASADDPDTPAGLAELGMSGPSQPLPHADAIDGAFGHHDISAIDAHIGGPARDAAMALNAQAYATGRSVAFAEAPDLHTAAHEAAHVVQQRAGVHLIGGLDQPGDAHERHADAVADAVVAGRSAEALLDQYGAPATTSPASVPVQRQTRPETDERPALRLVPLGPTRAFVANRSTRFVVRQSRADRSDERITADDRTITFSRGYPRLRQVVVYSPFTPNGRPCAEHGGAAIVHLMGDGDHRIVATVERAPGDLVTTERTVHATRTRAEVEAGFEAESRAAADAAPLTRASGPREARLRLTVSRVGARRAAAGHDILPPAAWTAWDAAFTALVTLLPALEASAPSSEWEAAALTLDDFLDALPAATPEVTAATHALTAALRAGDGITALNQFDALANAFDALLADRLTGGRDADQIAHQLRAGRTKDEALAALEDLDDIRPVPARFHPRDLSISAGGIIDVPLEWYIWADAEQWHLRDITTGTKTFTYSYPRRPGEQQPPVAFFAQVDNSEHFVEGELYYTLPDGTRRHLTTTEPMAPSDWLALFGTVLLGVGFGLVTLGAGAVVAWGNGLLILSGGAFAGSAAAHIAEQADRGTLTATGILLDSLQILASLATAGTAALTARALRSGAALGLQQLRGSLTYITLSRAALGADLATVVVMTADAWQQLDAICNGPGSDEDKARAVTILLGTLIAQGALSAVAARNELGALDGRPARIDADGDELVLRPPDDAGRADLDTPERQPPERQPPERDGHRETEPDQEPRDTVEPPAPVEAKPPTAEEIELDALRERLNPDGRRGLDAFISSEAERGRSLGNTLAKLRLIYDDAHRAALRQDQTEKQADKAGRRAVQRFLIARVDTTPDPLWRGRPRIEDGNLDEGWRHIDARHVTGDHPRGAGDLFPPGTTREELQAIAERIVARGTRQDRGALRLQSFTRRVTIRGEAMNVLVTVDSVDGRVITMFPMLGGG